MIIVVESAIKLDKDTQTDLEKLLASRGSEIEYKVNPSVLGGLRVTIGGKRIDASLAGKLRSVGAALA